MSKVVGDKIKSIRLERGETLEEFGKRFNTSKVTVFNWEKGRNLPNKSNLKEIAELGNMTVSEMLRTNVKNVGLNKAVGSRIRNIRTHILGLSMSDFGKKIDSNAKSGTVANWETGKNLPNNNRLLKIAKLGNVTVDELLGNTCQLCTGNEFKASWYAAADFELDAEYAVTEDRQIIIPILNSRAEYLGFLDIDINYCPECGRKLEAKHEDSRRFEV